jgi:hypothetical protein
MEEKQTLRQWLDALEAEGKEVKVTWEGGNDDGSFSVYVDDKEIDIEHKSMGGLLVDVVADEIAYGSFAGDYSTNGELFYSKGELTGIDYYSSSESACLELRKKDYIRIEVPEYLWFDTLSINTEGYHEDDGIELTVNFNITNGPVVDEHTTLEETLSEMLEKTISERLDHVKEQVNYVSNDWNFRFDEGEIIDGKRVFFIKEIDYNYEDGEDKDICIEITDDAEEEMIARKKEEEERWNKMREEWANKNNNEDNL